MSIEAMKQALEALEDATKHIFLGDKNGVEANIRAHKQCESLRQAIAEAEKQEPVGEVSDHDWSTGLLYRDLEPGTPLYTTPQQRKPLTDDEIAELWLPIYASTPPSGIHEDGLMPWRLAKAVEAAHGIKE